LSRSSSLDEKAASPDCVFRVVYNTAIFYEGNRPEAFEYRFRLVCVVAEETEALRIVDGLAASATGSEERQFFVPLPTQRVRRTVVACER
jgi:hypothetical protein